MAARSELDRTTWSNRSAMHPGLLERRRPDPLYGGALGEVRVRISLLRGSGRLVPRLVQFRVAAPASSA